MFCILVSCIGGRIWQNQANILENINRLVKKTKQIIILTGNIVFYPLYDDLHVKNRNFTL